MTPADHPRPDAACSDPDCSYRMEVERRTLEAESLLTDCQARATYWRNECRTAERKLAELAEAVGRVVEVEKPIADLDALGTALASISEKP